MNFDDVINNRKTTRKYDSNPISKELLNKILAMGIKAPIASAKYNKMHITVVQNDSILQEMREAVSEYFGKKLDPFYGAPTLIIVSGTQYKPIGFGECKWSQENIEIANAACIIENILLTATSLGVSSAYITGFISGFSVNKDLFIKLNIPKKFRPIGGVLLGYSKDKTKKMRADGKISIDYIY